MMRVGAEVLKNYFQVKDRVSELCKNAKRLNADVRLVVVSKFQRLDVIRILLEVGHSDFAENRIEEVKEKWPTLLLEYPNTKLHFIGPIQSRKVRDIVTYADYIHSLDRLEIAQRIAQEMQIQSKTPECLIQVNVGSEVQKSGILAAQFPTFLEDCKHRAKLPIIGAMCLPPANQNPMPYFQEMQQLQVKYHLNELSMGMSNDYAQAIACGATMIRVGTGIFGLTK